MMNLHSKLSILIAVGSGSFNGLNVTLTNTYSGEGTGVDHSLLVGMGKAENLALILRLAQRNCCCLAGMISCLFAHYLSSG